MPSEVPSYSIQGLAIGKEAALQSFQEAVRDVFSAEPVESKTSSASIHVTAWHLGTIMMGVFSGPPLMFDRSPSLIAQGGLDHFLVQVYTKGGFEGMAGVHPIRVCPGDVCVFDLTDTLTTRTTAFTAYSMLIPRDILLSAMDHPEQLHGHVIPARAPLAAMLGDYVTGLAARLPLLDEREAMTAAAATASLTSTILSDETGLRTTGDHRPGQPSPLRRICAYIDAHIADPQLASEQIERALGISRASLYRLFAASGGVARYIRRQRLSGAALELSDTDSDVRIGDLAERWGFVSDTSFSRAFRQAFGINPSTVKRDRLAFLAAKSESGGGEDYAFAMWMRTLHAGRSRLR